MKKLGTCSNSTNKNIVSAPGYPFTTKELFQELRELLSRELRERMTFDLLGTIIGRGRGTTHRWFDFSSRSQITALFCFLERLPREQRHEYIDAHCRTYPILTHQRLAYSPANTGKLMRLLELPSGLTFIVGGTEASRTFLVTALGHASQLRSGNRRAVAGIDLHRPDHFVAVPGMTYIDGALGFKHISKVAAENLPKVLASSAPMLCFNGAWSLLPGWRDAILRCAKRKHVIVADAGTPDLIEVKKLASVPINVVTVSTTKLKPECIRVNWLHLKSKKRL